MEDWLLYHLYAIKTTVLHGNASKGKNYLPQEWKERRGSYRPCHAQHPAKPTKPYWGWVGNGRSGSFPWREHNAFKIKILSLDMLLGLGTKPHGTQVSHCLRASYMLS